jgi:hypothetical protein
VYGPDFLTGTAAVPSCTVLLFVRGRMPLESSDDGHGLCCNDSEMPTLQDQTEGSCCCQHWQQGKGRRLDNSMHSV